MDEIKILMMDGCTESEAKKHLKDGTVIFEDFDENLEEYLDELDIEEEDRNEYRKMVTDKIPVADWGVVDQDGKTYYIMYSLWLTFILFFDIIISFYNDSIAHEKEAFRSLFFVAFYFSIINSVYKL